MLRSSKRHSSKTSSWKITRERKAHERRLVTVMGKAFELHTKMKQPCKVAVYVEVAGTLEAYLSTEDNWPPTLEEIKTRSSWIRGPADHRSESDAKQQELDNDQWETSSSNCQFGTPNAHPEHRASSLEKTLGRQEIDASCTPLFTPFPTNFELRSSPPTESVRTTTSSHTLSRSSKRFDDPSFGSNGEDEKPLRRRKMFA